MALKNLTTPDNLTRRFIEESRYHRSDQENKFNLPSFLLDCICRLAFVPKQAVLMKM